MAIGDKQAIDILVPLSGKGGVENVINQVAGYLVKQNYRVRVVQMVFDGPEWLDREIDFYPLRKEKVNDILDFIPMYRQFMTQTYVPNMVIATPWPYMTLAARKALEYFPDISAKVVAWLHAPLEIYKKYGTGGAECLDFADKIVVLNERSRVIITNLLPKADVEIACNPVDFLKCRQAVPSGNRCLLFVGRLSEEKCVSVILDAIAASSTGWRLRIIGDGDQRRLLVQQAESLGIMGRVEFLGWKSNPWDYAQDADALVLASEYEAFPLVAIEAMACGLFVFSTPVDGVIELVRPGENGFLFEKGKSEELAELLDLYAKGVLPKIDASFCRQSVEIYEAGAALESFERLLKTVFDKISVIIPCYNVSGSLDRCLNSIFEQQLDSVNLEVICVDDKSTDATLDILMKWEARFPEQIMVIPLEKNGKQGKARNIALQYASGNYITYVDADDALAPGYFKRLYEIIRTNNCDVAGCGYQIVLAENSKAVPILDMENVFDFENSVADLQKYLMLCGWKTSPWGRIYRTDFLRQNNVVFAEDVFMEDIFFFGRCLKYMKKYVHIPDALYLYYYNPNGTMASEKAKEYYLDTAIVQNMTVDELLACNRFESCINELAYTYFSKAFTEPMMRMWENPEFFSYKAYCYLKENVKIRFPEIEENVYLKMAEDQETKVAFAFYKSNIPSEEILLNIMGYNEAERGETRNREEL